MEEGCIVHWQLEESLLDHAFFKLGLQGRHVNHPIIMTEPPCNINLCRARKLLWSMFFILFFF